MATSTVPQVTEDDLREFHARHFPNAPLPSEFFPTQDQQVPTEEDDDGLGWYPDGVKRTLTKEQIQIFRHSEIQKLLRGMRAEREGENDTDGSDAKSTKTKRYNRRRPTGGKRGKHPQQDVAAEHPATKKLKKNDADQSTRPKEQDRNQRPGTGKWADYVAKEDSNPNSFTHRRLAREQDEMPNESIELDY